MLDLLIANTAASLAILSIVGYVAFKLLSARAARIRREAIPVKMKAKK